MQADTLSLTFAALADPTRRAILKRLAEGPTNVKELSRPFDMSGPAVCKHLLWVTVPAPSVVMNHAPATTVGRFRAILD